MAEESGDRDRDPVWYKVVDFLDSSLALLFGDVLVSVLIVIGVLAVAAVTAGLMVEFAVGLVILLVCGAAFRFLYDWT